jgi:hypothetical protein
MFREPLVVRRVARQFVFGMAIVGLPIALRGSWFGADFSPRVIITRM